MRKLVTLVFVLTLGGYVAEHCSAQVGKKVKEFGEKVKDTVSNPPNPVEALTKLREDVDREAKAFFEKVNAAVEIHVEKDGTKYYRFPWQSDGKTSYPAHATLYVHKGYQGGGLVLTRGTEIPDLSKLAFVVDGKAKSLAQQLSSAKVEAGTKVQLFSEKDFKGDLKEVVNDLEYFDNWNDRALSVRVLR